MNKEEHKEIKEHIKKHHLFKYKYPRLTLFILCIVVAYFIFRHPSASNFISSLGNYGFLGVFIAGILLSFGFTAPFAAGYFIALNPIYPFLVMIVSALGTTLGNLVIFNLIKISFIKEINKLEKEKYIRFAEKVAELELGKKIEHYFLLAVSGFIIASPLPNEIGISMLAGLTHIKQSALAIISFILSILGILVLLFI